jgi:ligand-binding SRPBCC domain-containing protein
MAIEFVLRDEIVVHAPVERCFKLSTSLAIVELELKMRPVSGRTEGLVAGGDRVLWRGWKFGLPQHHESLIDGFDPPRYFRDRMLAGRFAAFAHDHFFDDRGEGRVRMRDEVRFTMPAGVAGALAGKLFLVPHVRRLLRRRLAGLKRIAESEQWRRYLPET